MTALSDATLPELGGRLDTPGYDRAGLQVGIVHLGVGGFHRAHQARYLDRLLEQGHARDWAICGVGILAADEAMRDALSAQDGLYTVVEKSADGTLAARVVGSIVEYLLAPDDPERVIERMADPGVRIVSLTITEGGYNIDTAGHFDAEDPGVVADLAGDALPRTAFGLLVEALVRRRDRGVAPFTVMSCDNVEGNGDLARTAVTAYACLRSDELGEWVAREVAFPNAMVDRITPTTTLDDQLQLAERCGVVDRWPVVCEPYTQWVLQERFSNGRPPWEDVGVQVVDDVEPYESMKLRLLNAGHQAIGYLGYLAGYRLVADVCADQVFVDFLRGYFDEATPTLAPVPGVDLAEYRETLLARFANPEVSDTLARLCAESSDRIPKFLLPVVRDNLADGELAGSALVVAAWARYAEGTDEQGEPIEVVDRLADTLTEAARSYESDPLAFLSRREVFGDLVDDERFTAAYRWALDSLHTVGARATIEALAQRPCERKLAPWVQ